MPQTIILPGADTPIEHIVATEEELLEFVNKGRAAGGANVLEALLPSTPGESESCLIAVGLNFGCSVSGHGERWESGALKWHMELPYNMTSEQGATIAEALDSPLVLWASPRYEDGQLVEDGHYVPFDQKLYEVDGGSLYILLPEPIGNAAMAFDERKAFTNFIVEGCCDGDCSVAGAACNC